MKHPFAARLIAISGVAVATMLATAVLGAAPQGALAFEWRWFAVPVIVAILVTVYLLVLVFGRVNSTKGALFWFKATLILMLLWLFIMLCGVLASTPAGGAFWQGLLPFGWLGIAVTLLFFVMCYLDDSEYPMPAGPGVAVVITLFVLLFVAGMTDFIEPHHINASSEEYYGFQSRPGPYYHLVTGWVALIAVACFAMTLKAYRASTNALYKKQLGLFLFGFGQYLVIAVINDIILYPLFPHSIPPGSVVYVTVLNAVVSYAIVRHGVFSFTPASLAEPILQNLSEGIVGLNTDLRVAFSNLGAEHIFGRSIRRLEGMRLDKLFVGDSAQRIADNLLSKQRAFTLEDIDAQHGVSTVPIALSATQVLDDRGKLAGHVLVLRNVTELQKKTIELAHEKASVERKVIMRTRQLHEEQARLRASIEDLALGFILVDANGKIIVQNKALQSILDAEGTVHDLRQLFGSDHHFNIMADIERVKRTHKQIGGKEVAAGEKILRIFITPVITASGGQDAFAGMVILIEDITEVKVLERSRDEFFSIASHELRTPLTAIRGNAKMAIDYYPGVRKNTELRQSLDDIHESSVRLIEIVNDFLDMSRLEQGKIAFEFQECAVDEIIENILYELKPVIREKKLRVTFSHMQLDTLPKVWADKNRVKQILYNLIGNAVKFTDEGTVAIRASVRRKVIAIQVADTGRGIPLASRKLLFHKFQQAGESLLTRDTTRGTGLGLYISQLLAAKMGGTITLVRSDEGEGSVFEVCIPVATPERMEAVQRGLPQVDAATGLTLPTD